METLLGHHRVWAPWALDGSNAIRWGRDTRLTCCG